MPLVNCTDCGRDVSTRARFCPHCGNPTPVKRCNVVCALLTGAFVAVLVLVGVGMSKAACMKAKARAHAIRCCEEVQTAPVAAPVAPEKAPEKPETPKEY